MTQVQENTTPDDQDFIDEVKIEEATEKPVERRKKKQATKVADTAEKATQELPEALEIGDKILFRINKDGSITKEWYIDANGKPIVNGTTEAATSRGFKCEIEHISDVDTLTGNETSGGYRCKCVFGWFKMVEEKDRTGEVINVEEFNLAGGRWGFSADRSPGVGFKKNLDIFTEAPLSTIDECVGVMRKFIGDQLINNRKREQRV